MELPANPSHPTFDAERTWRGINRVLEFGDRLDFVLIEFSSPEIFDAWHFALRAWSHHRGQPWSEPGPSQSVLDWLEAERTRGLELELRRGEERPREVYLGVIPQDDEEGNVFARINENRDNLVRALNGVLCLCGSGDFVRRIAYAAPSIWAMRTRSFDLAGPPPPAAPSAKSEAGGLGPSTRRPKLGEVFELDVFISAAPRDEKEARDLAARLAGEGLSARVGADDQAHAMVERARLVVVLLSPEYAYSKTWDALQNTRLASEEPESLKRRLVPVLLGDAVIPGLLRGTTPLDFRTPESRARDYQRLILRGRGEREQSAGPGLAPATPALSTDTAWLDKVPLDFSHPNVRELLNVLSSAYRVPEAKNVALRAGIPLHRIRLDGPISVVWHDMLEQAANSGQIRALVEMVLTDPDVQGYRSAIRRIVGQSGPDSRA